MLSSLLFLSGVMFFVVVVIWSIRNDAPGNEGGFSGLLAMKPPQPKQAPRRRGRH